MGNVVPLSTRVETVNGEVVVTINLNLNIKLDPDGNLSVDAKVAPHQKRNEEVDLPDMDKVRFEKPDLEDNKDIIDNFGRQV